MSENTRPCLCFPIFSASREVQMRTLNPNLNSRGIAFKVSFSCINDPSTYNANGNLLPIAADDGN